MEETPKELDMLPPDFDPDQFKGLPEEPAPIDNIIYPKKSRYGRASSQGRDRNRNARNRVLAHVRWFGKLPEAPKGG